MGNRHNQTEAKDNSLGEGMTKKTSSQSSKRRKTSNNKVNSSLKGMYDDVVKEPVPESMNNFDAPATEPSPDNIGEPDGPAGETIS